MKSPVENDKMVDKCCCQKTQQANIVAKELNLEDCRMSVGATVTAQYGCRSAVCYLRVLLLGLESETQR